MDHNICSRCLHFYIDGFSPRKSELSEIGSEFYIIDRRYDILGEKGSRGRFSGSSHFYANRRSWWGGTRWREMVWRIVEKEGNKMCEEDGHEEMPSSESKRRRCGREGVEEDRLFLCGWMNGWNLCNQSKPSIHSSNLQQLILNDTFARAVNGDHRKASSCWLRGTRWSRAVSLPKRLAQILNLLLIKTDLLETLGTQEEEGDGETKVQVLSSKITISTNSERKSDCRFVYKPTKKPRELESTDCWREDGRSMYQKAMQLCEILWLC